MNDWDLFTSWILIGMILFAFAVGVIFLKNNKL